MMPRLPEELIQRIKRDIDLVQLTQSQGYELKKNGKDYRLSCPWHDDKEPSLVVSPDTNLWHCMGACQTGGSVIDWVMKTQGVSFRLACEILQKDQGLVTSTQQVKRNTTKKLNSPLAANADNQKLLHQVIDYYHEILKQSPEALTYLEKRGLNSPELIHTFKLGYANRTLCYRLPERNRKAGAEIRGQLQEMGILRQSGHEHFNGSVVVPIIDELAIKPDIIKKDLGKLLLKLEEIQENQQQQANESALPEPLSDEEQAAALALLQDTQLVNRIREDFTKMGIVGESSNTLVGYLGCVSRLLDKPLAVMIQSSSAADKSSLMEAILALMPENERVQYSAMTGQSLFYLGETSLQHKILAISEEEGASNASYALKLLQSEGEVTIASTGKDNDSGQLVTQEYTVKGPTMLFMTTTAIDIDEELLNRCLVLSVNESRAQTQAIHHLQRDRRMAGRIQESLEREVIMTTHRHAQQLLRSFTVINPYADQLTFVSDKTRTRRDHEKYLTLIDCIALLHQYQREVKTLTYRDKHIDYIEVSLDDIELANELAHEVLGRTLDELPPQTRKLLTLIQQMVKQVGDDQQIEQQDYRFGRKVIRDFTGWSDGQLKIHCKRLEDMEYLLVHRGGRGQSIEYELVYTGDITDKAPQLMGLVDVNVLRQRYDEQKLGVKRKKSGESQTKLGSSQGQVRPKLGGGQGSQKGVEANKSHASGGSLKENPENAYIGEKRNGTSYRSDSFSSATAPGVALSPASMQSSAAKNPLNS